MRAAYGNLLNVDGSKLSASFVNNKGMLDLAKSANSDQGAYDKL
jgi:hypothetical protein